MYADPAARGGVLEPEGIVEIKFRTPDLIAAMHRLDPGIRRLKEEGSIGVDGAIKKREAELLPIYRQVSCLCTASQAYEGLTRFWYTFEREHFIQVGLHVTKPSVA